MQINVQQNLQSSSLGTGQVTTKKYDTLGEGIVDSQKIISSQSLKCEESKRSEDVQMMKQNDLETIHIITVQYQDRNQLHSTFKPSSHMLLSQTNNSINITSKPITYKQSTPHLPLNTPNNTLTHHNQIFLNKNLLNFHQTTPKSKVKRNIFQQITTKTNFHSLSFNNTDKNDIPHLKNSSFRNSQDGKQVKSLSRIHENKLKKSIQDLLLKNYHKIDSKYFPKLQKYIKTFIEFQDLLLSQPFKFSLFHDDLESIKQKVEIYLQKKLTLSNLPDAKPSAEWNQQKLKTFFTEYKPVFLACQSINSLTQKLTLKKYKNCVYFGHMVNGKKQDQGIIYYFNGKLFEGTFKADQKQFGFQIQPEEHLIYIGEFEKGVRHGSGMLKNNEHFLWGKFTMGEFETKPEQDTSLLVGKQTFIGKNLSTISDFNENLKNKDLQPKIYHKQGFKLTFNSIIVYSFEFVILKNSSNDIFIGTINEETEQKHGQGLQIFINGDLYIGNYENNLPDSYGEYYWATGAFYRGQFLSGMRHGKGKWQMLHADSYHGDYMNDKKNGEGVYLWKNGSMYIGTFQNDYRHGFGEMRWNDGRIYKGQWINGIQKNVTIELDHRLSKTIKTKNISNTIPMIQEQKKTSMSKRYNLPTVQKKELRSVSIPSARTSFQTIDSSYPVRKKITLQNIKALYNPSNH